VCIAAVGSVVWYVGSVLWCVMMFGFGCVVCWFGSVVCYDVWVRICVGWEVTVHVVVVVPFGYCSRVLLLFRSVTVHVCCCWKFHSCSYVLHFCEVFLVFDLENEKRKRKLGFVLWFVRLRE